MNMRIKFNMGNVADVEQVIDITEEGYTARDVIELLNCGSLVTSISKGGAVHDLNDGFKRIGVVEISAIEHDLSYSDFELLEVFED